MKILFCVLLLIPTLVRAEMYQCEEHGHMVYQSWPCNAVLHRHLPAVTKPAPALSAANVQAQNRQNILAAALQNEQPKMLEEERLFFEHRKAVAESMQNPAIQAIRDLFN